MSDEESKEPLTGNRTRTFQRQLSKNVHTFFGVNKDTRGEQQHKWRSRSLRLTGHQPSISPSGVDSALDYVDATTPITMTPLSITGRPVKASVSFNQPLKPPPQTGQSRHSYGPSVSFSVADPHSVSIQPSYTSIQRQASTASNLGSRQDRIINKREIHPPHKESISNMVLDCFKTLRVPEKKSRKPCHYSRSFTPKSMAAFCGDEIFSPRSGQITPSLTPGSPEYTATMYDTCDSLFDSVFFDETVTEYQTEVATPRMVHTTPGRRTPNREHGAGGDLGDHTSPQQLSPIASLSERDSIEIVETPQIFPRDIFDREGLTEPKPPFDGLDEVDFTQDALPFTDASDRHDISKLRRNRMKKSYRISDEDDTAAGGGGGAAGDTVRWGEGFDQTEGIADRISSKWMAEFNGEDNSDRKQTGLGIMGFFLNTQYRSDAVRRKQELLDNVTDKRAYFTWWVTFVQTVIYLISVAVYGMAPFGIEEQKITGEVIKPNLAIERVFYYEQENMWIGPRRADLIHMGAKFSPCMRRDQNIQAILDEAIEKERHSGCCIRNDGSGCIQTSKSGCSKILSTWYNNSTLSHGKVCGQDPRYCKKPTSQGVYTWNKTDITRWPICYSSSKSPEKHMSCTINSRPCCIGILGNCIMTTREYCTFRRGYFHEEANLCSQVSCMGEICGMLSFLDPNEPAQFYRLWISLFLHAGLIQLLISIAFQLVIMRDIEKLAGWFRIMIIYLMCGVAGSLSSAIFLPYHVEAGPAGSQFGILACSFAELLQNCKLLVNPWKQIAKLSAILFGLFVFGLLPYVDNYAHLIGFLQGLLLSFALLPNVMGGEASNIRKKMTLVVVSLLVSTLFFILLLILFYVVPVYNCPGCQYFNCIPFTDKFCQSMEVQIKEVVIKD